MPALAAVDRSGLRRESRLHAGGRTPSMLSERQERIAEVEAEIDSLLAHILMLREMLQRDQCLLEAPYRFPVGRAQGRLETSFPAIY